MSSNNPFQTGEPGEEPPERDEVEATERVRELEREIEQLESESVSEDRLEQLEQRLAELESEHEGEDDEDAAPEPDYPCACEDCDGFALEEVDPEHVTAQKTLMGAWNRPKRVECPRCGEEMGAGEIVPKEEQKSNLHGGTPLTSNDAAAGVTLREEFEEAGREDVLEDAEAVW